MAKKCNIKCVSFRNGHPLTDEDRVIIARNWMNQRMARGEFDSYRLVHTESGKVVYDSETGLITVGGISLAPPIQAAE